MRLRVFYVAVVGYLFVTVSCKAQEVGHIYCGQALKQVALFSAPKVETAALASLQCGERVTVLEHRGNWIRLRTENGIEGFTSKWFVDSYIGAAPPKKDRPSGSKGPKRCERPSPFENEAQFVRIHTALQGYIRQERFSPKDLREVTADKIEDLAAGAYIIAYATAENPGKEKADYFKKFTDNRVFGETLSTVSPEEQIRAQVWLQKVLNVLPKAFDLGYADGAKLPCE